MLKLDRMRPPVRRVLALDAGSRCIKLLLAESDFGRLHILKEELIDLQAEGLVSAEEIKAHLQASLDEWGRPPLALVLPQHLSISQVIDLPLAPESEVEKLIRDETIKLGGVSESRIVYDFVRTETAAKNRQQFWVTLSQEGRYSRTHFAAGRRTGRPVRGHHDRQRLDRCLPRHQPALLARDSGAPGRPDHGGGRPAGGPGRLCHQFPDGRRFLHPLPGAAPELLRRNGGVRETRQQSLGRPGGVPGVRRGGGWLGGGAEAAVERMVRA